MKKDEMYYARGDGTFSRWRNLRKERFVEPLSADQVYDLCFSAFNSGIDFGENEAEIQSAINRIGIENV